METTINQLFLFGATGSYSLYNRILTPTRKILFDNHVFNVYNIEHVKNICSQPVTRSTSIKSFQTALESIEAIKKSGIDFSIFPDYMPADTPKRSAKTQAKFEKLYYSITEYMSVSQLAKLIAIYTGKTRACIYSRLNLSFYGGTEITKREMIEPMEKIMKRINEI